VLEALLEPCQLDVRPWLREQGATNILGKNDLGFRVDEPTKALIERAHLERRKLTDFCMTALTDAARRTIAEHETLVLSGRDRTVFFDPLVNPRAPSERLQRAFAEHKRRVVS
jgi:uncharacterized protein (DUF1778 family)